MFRSGCAITLALTGTDLQSIMGHVGWCRQSTASYYMPLSNVLSANSPSLTLTGQEVNIVYPGDLYQNCYAQDLSLENGGIDQLGLGFFPFPIPVFYTEVERMDVAIHFHPSISHPYIFMCIVGT